MFYFFRFFYQKYLQNQKSVLPLHSQSGRKLPQKRGNSSVGRAQPCQGWGREFESRFPLTRSFLKDLFCLARVRNTKQTVLYITGYAKSFCFCGMAKDTKHPARVPKRGTWVRYLKEYTTESYKKNDLLPTAVMSRVYLLPYAIRLPASTSTVRNVGGRARCCPYRATRI